VRMLKGGHALALLLLVTLGLFLFTTLGFRGPAPEPGGDVTVTVFTDLPGPPDAPAMGLGGLMLGFATIWALLAFVAVILGALTAWALTAWALKRCTSRADLPALLN
jgi:hypothetical protein